MNSWSATENASVETVGMSVWNVERASRVGVRVSKGTDVQPFVAWQNTHDGTLAARCSDATDYRFQDHSSLHPVWLKNLVQA